MTPLKLKLSKLSGLEGRLSCDSTEIVWVSRGTLDREFGYFT